MSGRNGNGGPHANGADSERIDPHTADLTDPSTFRALAIQTSEEAREANLSGSRHHAEVMGAIRKLRDAQKTTLDELDDIAGRTIALDAWRLVMSKQVWPQHEQRVRELEAAIKVERDARRKLQMQQKDLKEDVEDVTGKHEAMLGERASRAEAQLEKIDARRFEWRKLVVGAGITIAVLSPWAAFLAFLARGGK